MKQTLLLHGWFQKPTENWFPWLRQELEKSGYTVSVPDLPTMQTNSPRLDKLLKVIDKTTTIDRQTTIIGHSLGCLIGLRLAEKFCFNKLILVAGWDFNDLTFEHRFFWKIPINHKKIISNVKNIVVIHSDNDPYITAFQAEEMSKRLKAVKFVLVKGAGHFGKDDHYTQLPQILKFV